MKLLTMKCIKDPYLSADSNPAGGVLGSEEHFIKFECEAEQGGWAESRDEHPYSEYWFGYWDGYLSAKLDRPTTDEHIYCYLDVSEPDLAVGETYEDADHYVWERIA